MGQAPLFQRTDDQGIERWQLPRLRQGRAHRQHHSLSAVVRFRPASDELSAMIGDKSSTEVLIELPVSFSHRGRGQLCSLLRFAIL